MTAKTILIVDDSPIDQDILQAIVTRLGYPTEVRSDGFEAMQFLNLHVQSIAAILLDIYMPGVDGISMMGHLGKKYPDLPVIVISGSEDPLDMNTVTKLGAVGYIQKPLPLDTVQETLRDILSKVV